MQSNESVTHAVNNTAHNVYKVMTLTVTSNLTSLSDY